MISHVERIRTASAVGDRIRALSQHKKVKILEMNIQSDHVHVLAMVPPEFSIPDACGISKMDIFCQVKSNLH